MSNFTSEDLINLYDLLYEENDYLIQNVIRTMLRICEFNPDKFKAHLSRYINNHKNSREPVKRYIDFRTAMYAPFKDLPKIVHTFGPESYLSVVQWRLKIGA